MAATPYWAHGYRCHGYWLDGVRVGWVGLSPSCGRQKLDRYSWGVVAKTGMTHNGYIEGDCDTLRAAKRMVEKTYRSLQERTVSKKTIEFDEAEIKTMVAKAMVADGRVAKGVVLRRIDCDGLRCSVEYEPAAGVPSTETTLDLKYILVEKQALLLEQCQLAGISFDLDIMPAALLRFTERSRSASRFEPTRFEIEKACP